MGPVPRFDPNDSLSWVREPERFGVLRSWHLDLVSRRGWVVAGSGLAALWLAHLLGRRELMAVGLTLLALVGCAWLVVRLGRLAGQITRVLPERPVSVGEVVPVSLRCEQPAVIREVLPEGYPPAPSFQAPGRFDYELVFRRRGLHLLGPAQQRLADPCGLVDGLVDTGEASGVAVRAHCLRLEHSTALGERMLTGEARHTRSASVDYYDVGIRDHQQGDSLRQVHWKATARHGRLMVRQENYVATAHSLIVLDRRRSAWHGPGDLNHEIPQGTGAPLASTLRFEKALSLSCSIGELYARHGYQLMVRDLAGQELDNPRPTPSGRAGEIPFPQAAVSGASALDRFEAFHAATTSLGLSEGGQVADARGLAESLGKLLLGFADEPVFLVLGELGVAQARWLAGLSRTVRNVDVFLICAHPERHREAAAQFALTPWRVHLHGAQDPLARLWESP